MPQSPLPPEREPCLEFGIDSKRARRALNVLEYARLVYREVTRGTFVYSKQLLTHRSRRVYGPNLTLDSSPHGPPIKQT